MSVDGEVGSIILEARMGELAGQSAWDLSENERGAKSMGVEKRQRNCQVGVLGPSCRQAAHAQLLAAVRISAPTLVLRQEVLRKLLVGK